VDIDLLTQIFGSAVVAGLISAVVAFLNSRSTDARFDRESRDGQLQTLLDANQGLVDDLQTERSGLCKRVASLERARDRMSAEIVDLRNTVNQQTHELQVLGHREAELRVWASEIMAWAHRAVEMIRTSGGHVQDPPLPPTRTAGSGRPQP
jgi:septal ring factor EnvC (AmiA/AmiB activator)